MNRPDASSSPEVAAPAAAPPADPSLMDAAEVASALGGRRHLRQTPDRLGVDVADHSGTDDGEADNRV